MAGAFVERFFILLNPNQIKATVKAARPIRPNKNPGDTSLSPTFYQSFYFNPIRTTHYHLSTIPFSPALFLHILS